MIYGYVRVAKLDGDNLDQQINEVKQFTTNDEIIIRQEVASGMGEKKVLSQLLNELKEGDSLFITKADVISTDLNEKIDFINKVMERKINLKLINHEKEKIKIENKKKNLQRGIKYGYIGNIDLFSEQKEKLIIYGANKMLLQGNFLEEYMEILKEGDELLVNRILDLSENISEALKIIRELQRKKVILTILNQ